MVIQQLFTKWRWKSHLFSTAATWSYRV